MYLLQKYKQKSNKRLNVPLEVTKCLIGSSCVFRIEPINDRLVNDSGYHYEVKDHTCPLECASVITLSINEDTKQVVGVRDLFTRHYCL